MFEAALPPHDSHCAKEKESSGILPEDFLFLGKRMKN